jgi:putative Mn2+ efflux pump MntP
MAMCVVLSVAIEALLIASGLTVLCYEVVSASIVLFCATAVLAPGQLLTGGAIARRRVFTCRNHTLQHSR